MLLWEGEGSLRVRGESRTGKQLGSSPKGLELGSKVVWAAGGYLSWLASSCLCRQTEGSPVLQGVLLPFPSLEEDKWLLVT